MLLLSLVKAIEIIGEAASRVSPESRKEHPAIPWADIIGMRHRLIHGYFNINRDIVLATVSTELPPLISELTTALSASRDAPNTR